MTTTTPLSPAAATTDAAERPTGAALTALVTEAYREALGSPEIDQDSDFYAWGGDSLTAFRVTATLQDALGVEVAVALVFAYPTPADLADVVDADLAQV
ncbi:acyl carrier protein [Streptomyces sp. GSL17-111]|uniref:acyl carrier protein n=1 Tax=Streptomyces sp. GSL17-111 TaxID=3121596 RepID=UPI0030F4204A